MGTFSVTASAGETVIRDSSNALFEKPTVVNLRVRLGAREMESLSQFPREYVQCAVWEGAGEYPDVSLHLKGDVGSFQRLDERPSLTLNFSRRNHSQTFHGLSKIHLNNSVEDPSRLHEYLGSEIFRSAGIPATRVAWALVELNDRPLGLYVLKEGFTKEFLARHFTRADGNLYEPAAGRDVNEWLERDSGAGPDTQADLRALAAAALKPDSRVRWEKLEMVLDVPSFLSFMAIEVMIGHRDGYCMARNNYRIYHDPQRNRFVFLPHGMDQLFGRADATWHPTMAGLVARAVLETPRGAERYRARFEDLVRTNFVPVDLNRRVDQAVARIRPSLDVQQARKLSAAAADLKKRISARREDLIRQLARADRQPLPFTNEIAGLSGWGAVDPPRGGRLDQIPSLDGQPSLHILAGAITAASWRTKVLLRAGRYRFEGRVMIRGVRPLPFGRNQGAGLRVSGVSPSQPYRLIGDADWTTITTEFSVTSARQETELVCELRASAGEAWFDTQALRLIRLP